MGKEKLREEVRTRAKEVWSQLKIRKYGDRESVGLDCSTAGPSRTKQAPRDECDVNIIMSKYVKQGQVPVFHPGNPSYGDFSNATDYVTALNSLNEAQLAFNALPVEIRNRMENSPQKLMEFLADDNNYDEGVELGLYDQNKEESDPASEPPQGDRAPKQGVESAPDQ